jgi:hypothetical protein
MEEILYRLLQQLPDGSFKVVGYEKHEGGRIYHLPIFYLNRINYKTPDRRKFKVDDKELGLAWNDVYFIKDRHYPHYSRTPHDRKDMYTGVTVGGEKVFQRDIIERTTLTEDFQREDIYDVSVGYSLKKEKITASLKLDWENPLLMPPPTKENIMEDMSLEEIGLFKEELELIGDKIIGIEGVKETTDE